MGGTWNSSADAMEENDAGIGGEEPNEELKGEKDDRAEKLSELKQAIMGSTLILLITL